MSFNEYSMDDKLKQSREKNPEIKSILLKYYFDEVRVGNDYEDKCGGDFIGKIDGDDKEYFIDLKRQMAFSSDLIPLETISIGKGHESNDDIYIDEVIDIGWAKDPNKRTDYVMFYYEGGFHIILYFNKIRILMEDKIKILESYIRAGKNNYFYTRQKTKDGVGWYSEILVVPSNDPRIVDSTFKKRNKQEETNIDDVW